jgi:molybdopterin-guanine dinucleotide biosynthesis protein A
MPAVAAAVLAGGQSRRMGRDKAFLPIGGRPLIERTLDTLDRRFAQVLVVANDAEKFAHLGRVVTPDLRPGAGALAGIHAAVVRATGPSAAPVPDAAGRAVPPTHVFVCATDMPFLSVTLIDLLLAALAAPTEDGAPPDVVVPEDPDAPDSSAGLHPLCAIYGRRALPAIEERLDRGQLKVIGFYDAVRVRRVGRADFLAAGIPPHALTNANTPDDLVRAEALLARDSRS